MAFIQHHPCDRCGSRNNLAEYSNGFWCWTCRVFTPKNDLNSLRDRVQKNIVGKSRDNLVTSSNIPQIAKKWLMQYGLTKEEMEQFSWEIERSLLLLLVTENFWQGRTFAENAKCKYVSSGAKPIVFYDRGFATSAPQGNTLVMVEDVVSAVKVSRHAVAVPLLGSNVPKELLLSVVGRFSRYNLWLDRDKAKESLKQARNASQILGEVTPIVTALDPKELSDDEIREKLK